MSLQILGVYKTEIESRTPLMSLDNIPHSSSMGILRDRVIMAVLFNEVSDKVLCTLHTLPREGTF